LVVVAVNSDDPKTGPGPIALKKGKKTGPDRTLKHHFQKSFYDFFYRREVHG
jgi:hypothetical protein